MTLNYLQGRSLPKSIPDREEGSSERSRRQQDELNARSLRTMSAAPSKTSGKDFAQENNESADRVRPHAVKGKLISLRGAITLY